MSHRIHIHFLLLLVALLAFACAGASTTSSDGAGEGASLSSPILDFAEDDGTEGLQLVANLRSCILAGEPSCAQDAKEFFCDGGASQDELLAIVTALVTGTDKDPAQELQDMQNYFCDVQESLTSHDPIAPSPSR